MIICVLLYVYFLTKVKAKVRLSGHFANEITPPESLVPEVFEVVNERLF